MKLNIFFNELKNKFCVRLLNNFYYSRISCTLTHILQHTYRYLHITSFNAYNSCFQQMIMIWRDESMIILIQIYLNKFNLIDAKVGGVCLIFPYNAKTFFPWSNDIRNGIKVSRMVERDKQLCYFKCTGGHYIVSAP